MKAIKTLLAQIHSKRRKVEAMETNIQEVKEELARLEDKILSAFSEDRP